MKLESHNKELKHIEEIINNNNRKLYSNNDNTNNIANFISKNSQEIMNNNCYDFFKDKNFKAINDNNMKKDIFIFTCFINSCKSYKDISELNKDIKLLFKKKKIDNYDYIYNIIHNYLNNIYEILINERNFFKKEQNSETLLNILRNIDINLNINKNVFPDIIFKIVSIDNKILNILQKNNVDNNILESINILKKQINIVEKINNIKEDIVIHFDTYNKDLSNKDNKDNKDKNKSDCDEEKEDFYSLNKACFLDTNLIEKNGLNSIIGNHINKSKRKINDNNNKNEKKHHTMNNYENLMYPPIRDDSD